MAAGSDDLSDIHAATESYYSEKALTHGPTPAGVDWPSAATQELRIVQLLKSFSFEKRRSLNDLGCGYGAALDAISKYYPMAQIDYLGIDLSAEMIRLALSLWSRRAGASFIVSSLGPRVADYSIASGIFNVKLGCTTERWEQLVRKTLTELDGTSRRGFAVNFLAAEQGELRIQELYRTQPESWKAYCESEFGSKVDILSGYGLPEFTLVAFKSSAT